MLTICVDNKSLLPLFKCISGCQVGGHVKKGGKEDIFTGKGGQKEDIFYQKLIQINQKCI